MERDQRLQSDPLRWHRWAALICIASAAINVFAFLVTFSDVSQIIRIPAPVLLPMLGIFSLIGMVLGLIAGSKKLYQWWLVFALFVNFNVLMLICCGLAISSMPGSSS